MHKKMETEVLESRHFDENQESNNG